MKNSGLVIFSLLILCGGSFARIIAVLTKVPDTFLEVDNSDNKQLIRTKRQFGFGPFGQSSAQANANAFSNHFGPNGFGSSNSLAGAQSFNSISPLGGFGASAANSGSQNFNCGFHGCNGNAGFSASQSYNLPNGKTFSFALSRGYNFVPGQQPQFTNGDSFAFS